MQITSDIELSGAGCTTAITPNQLVQSSSENDIHAQPVRELDHRPHDSLVTGIIREPGDKGLVDFQCGDGAAFQMLQAGIAGAEVVGGEAHADGAQGVETGEQGWIAECDRFGQFDLQKLGGQGHIGQHPLYLVVERWPNLAGGHIDGKTERLPCRSLPLVHLATGLAQHPRAYFRHQAERLGQRQELAGRQQAKPRMPPAHQRFRASDPVIAQIDQRLVMQVKLSANINIGPPVAISAAALPANKVANLRKP